MAESDLALDECQPTQEAVSILAKLRASEIQNVTMILIKFKDEHSLNTVKIDKVEIKFTLKKMADIIGWISHTGVMVNELLSATLINSLV